MGVGRLLMCLCLAGFLEPPSTGLRGDPLKVEAEKQAQEQAIRALCPTKERDVEALIRGMAFDRLVSRQELKCLSDEEWKNVTWHSESPGPFTLSELCRSSLIDAEYESIRIPLLKVVDETPKSCFKGSGWIPGPAPRQMCHAASLVCSKYRRELFESGGSGDGEAELRIRFVSNDGKNWSEYALGGGIRPEDVPAGIKVKGRILFLTDENLSPILKSMDAVVLKLRREAGQ